MTKRSAQPAGGANAPLASAVPAPRRENSSDRTSGSSQRTDSALSGTALKDALLAEIRSGKKILYELSIAGAQKIEVADDAVTFTFGANQNMARGNLEQSRSWIENAAQRLAGRPIKIVVAQSAAPANTAERATQEHEASAAAAEKPKSGNRDLKAEAMSSSAVQAMLDVFPAEIRDVEEM